MQINFTKLYRLWHLLTTISILGLFITFYNGYDSISNTWNFIQFNLHTLFIGMLFSAVIIRVYMALNKINSVPLMHLIRAKTISQVIVALAYISMCTALLITLFSEIYLIITPTSEVLEWVLLLRNDTQAIFASMIFIHILYVIYLNIIHKNGSLAKLYTASNS